MRPCRACNQPHDPMIDCKVWAARHVVNAVVNALPVVVNKDRHKTSRTEYFREYMKVWRAVKSGRAEKIPRNPLACW